MAHLGSHGLWRLGPVLGVVLPPLWHQGCEPMTATSIRQPRAAWVPATAHTLGGLCLSRANTRRTPMSCHFPFPVAVGTPRAFNAFVMPYSDVTPAARISAMIGASTAACRSAVP